MNALTLALGGSVPEMVSHVHVTRRRRADRASMVTNTHWADTASPAGVPRFRLSASLVTGNDDDDERRTGWQASFASGDAEATDAGEWRWRGYA